MGASDDLIGLYWTTSGPVEVHFGREWSLFDLRDRCEQAARVGFSGHRALARRPRARARDAHARRGAALLDEHGLAPPRARVPAGTGSSTPATSGARAADERRALLFEAAAELPAHHIKVGNIPGTPCELPRIVEALRRALRRRRRAHDAKIVYEFMPYDVNVNDVDTALAVVEGADAPNGGLAIDTWHLGKLGLEPDDLRRIPPRFLGWVELSDGPYENMPDPLDEMINHRELPGEGEFPIARVRRRRAASSATTARGASRCSRRSCATCPIEQIFDRAYETTSAQLQ